MLAILVRAASALAQAPPAVGQTPSASEAASQEGAGAAALERNGRREARVHDPSNIVKCKDEYWFFATGPGVSSWRSKDLERWERGPSVFAAPPPWIADVVTGNRGYFWAPDVIHHQDRYWVYYSVSRFGVNTSAIALASSPTLDPADPLYRWTDHGIVIQSRKGDDFNAIDPAVTRTPDGALWLSFGSFWSGIKLVRLDPAVGKPFAEDSPLYSLARKDAIEAPFIHFHDGDYYLFVNWDRCCRGVNSTYNVRVGRSREITGPYLDREGNDLANGGGTLLLGTDGAFIGPGHAGILEEDGKSWFSCHFYDGTERGVSKLAIRPLRWEADGWPVLDAVAAFEAPPAMRTTELAFGADLSFLKQAEDRGTVFKDGGQKKPGLSIFKDHGYNWIRLRIFHTPSRLPKDGMPALPNGLAYTIASAASAKKLGFKLLLNFHYSDTWADPGKQTIPKAWQGKSHEELVQAVFDYTRDTIAAFREAGVPPDMVQIGNEITPGMLWPDGKLPDNWKSFAELVKAGVRGVEAGRGAGPRPRIMIHIDKGGNKSATKWFFDNLHRNGVEYDVIGQSYYPWWHGTLDDLRENLSFMANQYQKDIILVEVAYCWRPTEYKTKSGPFPESPQGQRQFLNEVAKIVLKTPNGRGIGIFWWEPAVTGGLRSRGYFDDDGNALPVINVFDRLQRK